MFEGKNKYSCRMKSLVHHYTDTLLRTFAYISSFKNRLLYVIVLLHLNLSAIRTLTIKTMQNHSLVCFISNLLHSNGLDISPPNIIDASTYRRTGHQSTQYYTYMQALTEGLEIILQNILRSNIYTRIESHSVEYCIGMNTKCAYCVLAVVIALIITNYFSNNAARS